MSIVIHNKTGKFYILIKLFAIDSTNGKHRYFSVYKRPFGKHVFVRRTHEFCMKFTHWKDWDFKNRRRKIILDKD